MTDGRVGRLLVATLHQAIGEVLPDRLEFYEEWLQGKRLRDGAMSIAPMTAVLGFLRTEGEPYSAVMAFAGRCAADWTVDGMSAFHRRAVAGLPHPLRLRAVLRMARRIVRGGFPASRVTAAVRRGTVRFETRGSLFCRVRSPQRGPLCAYDEAMLVRLLERFEIHVDARIESCHATGGAGCVVVADLVDPRAASIAR